VNVTDTAQLWERQRGEPPEAYEAFRVYLEMGPSRTSRQAFRQAFSKPDALQPDGKWNGWAAKWKWSDRARAWDNRAVAVGQEQVERAIKSKVVDWIKQRDKQVKLDLRTARKLQKCADTLADPSRVESRDLDVAARVSRISQEMSWKAIDNALGVAQQSASANPSAGVNDSAAAQAARKLRELREQMRKEASGYKNGPPGDVKNGPTGDVTAGGNAQPDDGNHADDGGTAMKQAV
jgi:hypothetical protein